ncbi:DUF6541 family protein [Enorma burkinafasonensis]|uniref:DUF6541 family protein n=1 Tax=Enorma burkinafasonensis TaxID=2590867 RepID=UPI0011A17CD4|nr:DUF6541 family protein [Enorma burkinafasonensis]
MWSGLLYSACIGLSLIVIPGFVLLRAMWFSLPSSCVLSPVVSAALAAVSVEILSVLGIPCVWWTVCLAMLLPSFVVGAFRCVRCRLGASVDGADQICLFQRGESDKNDGVKRTWAAIAMSVAIGGAICIVVYLSSIGSPEAFVQNYDSAFHATHVKEMLDAQNYSSLTSGFYPSLWHAFVAMISSATGASSLVAANAFNSVIATFVYPLSSVALVATIFPGNSRRVALGGICCTSIAYFPWRLMLFGPLYSNVLAFSFMPAAVACFIKLVLPDAPGGYRLRFGIMFCLSGIALLFAQPNAIFSAGVYLVPFIMWRLYAGCIQNGSEAKYRFKGVTLAVLFSVLVAAVWIALASSQFLQATVTYARDTPLCLSDALKWAFHLSFVLRRPQFIAGTLIAFGGIALLAERGRRWVVFSYLLSILLYVVAVSFDGHFRELLTGFWYNDYHRLAAAASVFAVPLLVAGLDSCLLLLSRIAGLIADRIQCDPKRFSAEKMRKTVCISALLLLMITNAFPLPFLPPSIRSTGFDAVRFELNDMYDTAGVGPLDAEELAFLDRVESEVGNEAVIANQPFDGSVFAYATNDLNVLFDRYNPPTDEVHDAVRFELFSIADNEEVALAARELSVEYVLQLDAGENANGNASNSTIYAFAYVEDTWTGINEIDENTPGFTLLLSEGDMRLYRVDWADSGV